ncbi:MAG: hypothetical protein PWP72_1351 [Thermoanaerobacter sp.]|jgi:hypothetical protein|nr:hypothetical protein [Desulfofundulus thermocisternus]MDK2888473.1 hypothetical protein [Thermoanaerobacter sp.]
MNSKKLLTRLEKRQKMFEEYLRRIRQGRKNKVPAGCRIGCRGAGKN